MRKAHPFVGIILVLWTMFTLGLLVLALIVYFQNRGTTPIRPGDPNIGLGIIYFAALLNVPTILCWLGIIWVEQDDRNDDDLS